MKNTSQAQREIRTVISGIQDLANRISTEDTPQRGYLVNKAHEIEKLLRSIQANIDEFTTLFTKL